MRTRRLLAAAVVAALPLFAGPQDATPPRSSADPARTLHVADRTNEPRWIFAAGWDWGGGWITGKRLSYYGWGPALALAW